MTTDLASRTESWFWLCKFLVIVYLLFFTTQLHAADQLKAEILTCILLLVVGVLFEPRRGKTNVFAYAKTKTQISFAVTANLISAFVFAN